MIEKNINTTVSFDGLLLYDPRDKKIKTSNNPALMLRDLYCRSQKKPLSTEEEEFISELANMADEDVFVPAGTIVNPKEKL
ncbi:MAG: hypothetical protein ABFD75_12220 [Smithella sp.]